MAFLFLNNKKTPPNACAGRRSLMLEEQNIQNQELADSGTDNYGYEDDYDDSFYDESSGGNTGKIVAIVIAVILVIGGAVGAGFYFLSGSTGQQLYVLENQTYELGDPVVLEAANFVDTTQMSADAIQQVELDSELLTSTDYEYDEDTGEVVSEGEDYLDTGEYSIQLTLGDESATSNLIVQDTTKPQFVGFAKEISIEQNAKDVDLESYWAAKDISRVSIKVLGEVDLTKAGEYEVRVIATDENGNSASQNAVVKIIESEEVRQGAELTKTKDGDVPLSEETVGMLEDGSLNTDNNDENIQKAQEEFEKQLEAARQEALAKQQINGWQSDGLYYIQGRPQTGPQVIDGQNYYFNEDGSVHTGWLHVNGEDYYYTADGIMVTGPQIIDGNYYFFDENGRKVVGWRNDGTFDYFYDVNGIQQFGPVRIDGKEYYFDTTTGAKYTGFRIANGKTYYYDASGAKAFGETKVDDATYYFNTHSGEMATGLISIVDQSATDGSKKTVLMDENGKMYYGFIVMDDHTYYFDVRKGGAMAHGQTVIAPEYNEGTEKTCYFDPESGIMQTGWVTEGEGETKKTYYYDATKGGAMATGLTAINESGLTNMYYFNEDGTQYFGLKTIGEFTYYFDPVNNGRAVSGIVTIPAAFNNGKELTAYFDSSFHMIKGLVQIGNDKYYFHPETGDMQKGFQDVVSGNTTLHCYFKEDGKMATGHTQIDGQWYYFDKNTGDMANDGLTQLAGDGTYYFLATGVRYVGQLQIENNWYYFDVTSGKMAVGPTKIPASYSNNRKEVVYFYNKDGIRSRGWQTIDGKTYYAKSDYTVASGWTDISGTKYYFDPSTYVQFKDGWKDIDNHTYYFESGKYVVNTLKSIDGHTYGFDGNGYKVVNASATIGGKTYRFDSNGYLVQGFYEDGGVLRYVTSSGQLVQNGTVNDGKYAITADANGKVIKTDTLNFPYYNQKGYKDGESMCGPTSMAMALQFLSGQSVSPDTMRNEAINAGCYTMGAGTQNMWTLVNIGSKYGVSATGLGFDANQAANRLIRGDIIVGTSSASPWVAYPNPTSASAVHHVMVLHGYNTSNGTTYVEDPYTPSLSGWTNLEALIREGSNVSAFPGLQANNGPWYALRKN